jgi:predicted Rossmann fold flavoprotein
MDKVPTVYDVIVIGGGASGMMAGAISGTKGKKVLILEKNKDLGEKLKISGGGRCNITNAEKDVRKFLANYGNAEQFLYSSFSKFSSKDTFDFFENLDLPLVIQARQRAFPHTEKAHDVYKALIRSLKSANVEIKTSGKVTKILCDKNEITGVVAGEKIYKAKSYILATGGVSHPETGSTGDGFRWLKDLGHKVLNPTPTIVPLAVSDEWIKSLAGVSMSFMKITFYVDGVKKFMKKGKILFTHFGLSGPLILNSAKTVADLLHTGIVTATIDAFPDTDLGALEKRIINVFDINKNKMLKNVFDQIAPEGTSFAILSLVSVDPDKKVHSVTKEERKEIVQILKSLPVNISGLMGFDRAVVADGGVSLDEIDTKTMRSKLYNNLYITGDLLHINRPSGGYSLQLCWTTGYVAGENA